MVFRKRKQLIKGTDQTAQKRRLDCDFLLSTQLTLVSPPHGAYNQTFVSPMAPMFPPYVDVACPHPKDPDSIVHVPSMRIPRLTACDGGGGTRETLAHA